jgi:hypothetical protein
MERFDMETVFPTSTPAMIEELQNEVTRLKADNERLQTNFQSALSRNHDLNTKISNVRGHILDLYSMNGEIDDDMEEVARLLDIQLTKRIQGEANLRITYTAEVPLDFDVNDFELSYEINCESYEAESFDFDEEYFEYESGDED